MNSPATLDSEERPMILHGQSVRHYFFVADADMFDPVSCLIKVRMSNETYLTT